MNEDYERGFLDALKYLHTIVDRDYRGLLAKECNFVPSWQKVLWEIAKTIKGMMNHVERSASKY